LSNAKLDIVEKVDIKNKSGLSQLLGSSIKYIRMLNSMELTEPVIEFRLVFFLKGIKPILNEVPNKDVGISAVNIIQTTFDIFGYSLSEEECFLLYALKDMGKFKVKDSKLFSDLENEWGGYPQFKMEKQEFKHALNELKNIKIIDVRRGAVVVVDQVTFQ
jgi:hypothetical protein